MIKRFLYALALFVFINEEGIAQTKSANPSFSGGYTEEYQIPPQNSESEAIVFTRGRPPIPVADAFAAGWATYYAHAYAGRLTSAGEVFDPNAFTAAHRYLPTGTMVRVVNQNNQKEVTVRINDRGPFMRGSNNVIDLSYRAAVEIDMINPGVVPVRIYVLSSVPEYVSRVPKDFEAWAIQVSASKDRVSSEKVVAKLGPQATLRSIRTAQGVIMYRVLYGRYSRKEEAIAAKSELSAKGFPNSFEKYLVDEHPDLAGIK
ncbi:MAG: septal ring lytic transglycosylase RlpA family protein [Bacteroidetes Order II. Incertae sedis bacterium]|nr:septal ring lytic transglycosylase RlpA family protein [Bacteroidetes Order II. bacterium]